MRSILFCLCFVGCCCVFFRSLLFFPPFRHMDSYGHFTLFIQFRCCFILLSSMIAAANLNQVHMYQMCFFSIYSFYFLSEWISDIFVLLSLKPLIHLFFGILPNQNGEFVQQIKIGVTLLLLSSIIYWHFSQLFSWILQKKKLFVIVTSVRWS